MHIGLDVDDKAFHGAGLCEKSGETAEFSRRPNSAAEGAEAVSKRTVRLKPGSIL